MKNMQDKSVSSTREELLEALQKIKQKYPAVYEHFFLAALNKKE
jgi:hypothetical protein